MVPVVRRTSGWLKGPGVSTRLQNRVQVGLAAGMCLFALISFVLPQAPARGADFAGTPPDSVGLSSLPRIHVSEILFRGNTILGTEALRIMSAPYEGREVTAEELETLRASLTRAYVDKGYINSGAILPDQEVTDGKVWFTIVEGRLAGVAVTGLQGLSQGYIENRLGIDPEMPFNIFELRERFRLLHLNPRIERVNGEISPGSEPGQAVLLLEVVESSPFEASLSFSNSYSPSTGSTGPEITLRHLNLTGAGDTLAIRYVHTRGTREAEADYTRPIGVPGMALGVFYGCQDSDIIEKPFDLIDITSSSSRFGASISTELIRKADHEMTLLASLEKRRAETFLFGESYGFSENSEDGKQDLTVVRLTGSWRRIFSGCSVAVRILVSQGLDILGAGGGPDSSELSFTSFQAQAQWVQNAGLIRHDRVIVRSSMQLARASLPSMERMGIGGCDSVRGYREDLYVRDNGAVMSLEYRLPLVRAPLPGVTRDQAFGWITLAPFADWGTSWYTGGSTDRENLWSIGLGIHWDPSERLHGSLYYGKGIKSVSIEDKDLQDQGIHFLMQWDML